VLEDMKALGARILLIAEDFSAFSSFEPDYLVELKSGLGEWIRGPLYLPILQRIAYHRALAKGLDPDKPTNLEAVVKLTREGDQ
jgi:glucosamine--fructose-6-phosphate aminotransferase (isomerizing)